MDFAVIDRVLIAPDADDHLERLYDDLRLWIREKVRTPQPIEETQARYELVDRVLARIELTLEDCAGKQAERRCEAFSRFALRCETLSDILSDTINFERQHSREELLKREHVRSILTILSKSSDRLSRNKLIKAVGLSDANLSRILSLIEAGGLVAREIKGREVTVVLTSEGKAALDVSKRGAARKRTTKVEKKLSSGKPPTKEAAVKRLWSQRHKDTIRSKRNDRVVMSLDNLPRGMGKHREQEERAMA